MHRPVDPQIERDITALMTCAPLGCSRECSCFRVARFARDQVRNLYVQRVVREPESDEQVLEQYAITRLYANTGAWEAA